MTPTGPYPQSIGIAFSQRLGDVPRKRHIQFRDNGTLLAGNTRRRPGDPITGSAVARYEDVQPGPFAHMFGVLGELRAVVA